MPEKGNKREKCKGVGAETRAEARQEHGMVIKGSDTRAEAPRALPLPLASFARVMMTNSSARLRGLRQCCSSYTTKLKWFRDRATKVSLATSALT